MITFLCYLALCIFLLLVQFGPPFFGTPINEEKGTRILFAITKKNDCLITVLPFSPTGAVLNCTVFIWWIYGASQHRMPSSLSILTPKQINLWFLFDEVFLCRKLIRWYWYSDQKNPRSWCKPSDTETYNALPTLPGIQRSE